MRKRIDRKFYTQPTLKVAKDLLGKYIVRKSGKLKIVGKIVETEAYIGPQDKASHAYLPRHLRKWRNEGKKTLRNKAEYLIGGHIYIYLVYGMYWQFNISTGKEGSPECVLIRALEPIQNNKNSKLEIRNPKQIQNSKFQTLKLFKNLANGPGKLCKWLKLNKSFYGEDLTQSRRIWLKSRGEKINPKDIKSGPRIGIDYAGLYWSKIKWRFWLKNSGFVSRRK